MVSLCYLAFLKVPALPSSHRDNRRVTGKRVPNSEDVACREKTGRGKQNKRPSLLAPCPWPGTFTMRNLCFLISGVGSVVKTHQAELNGPRRATHTQKCTMNVHQRCAVCAIGSCLSTCSAGHAAGGKSPPEEQCSPLRPSYAKHSSL